MSNCNRKSFSLIRHCKQCWCLLFFYLWTISIYRIYRFSSIYSLSFFQTLNWFHLSILCHSPERIKRISACLTICRYYKYLWIFSCNVCYIFKTFLVCNSFVRINFRARFNIIFSNSWLLCNLFNAFFFIFRFMFILCLFGILFLCHSLPSYIILFCIFKLFFT